MTTWVKAASYRLYDQDGRLLYVGVSANPEARLKQHRRRSHFGSRIARQDIDYYESPVDALLAERRDTLTLAPEFPTDVSPLGQMSSAIAFIAAWLRINGGDGGGDIYGALDRCGFFDLREPLAAPLDMKALHAATWAQFDAWLTRNAA